LTRGHIGSRAQRPRQGSEFDQRLPVVRGEATGIMETNTAALLLEDAQNLYQQLLVREAHASAVGRRVQLLEPVFAGGSAWNQVETINGYLRGDGRPDGLMVVPAGGEATVGTYQRVAKAGIPLVFLNRVPQWVEDLRSRFPEALLAGVTPNQVGIGRIQAEQALRLARSGANVMLVTGTVGAAAAVERKRGFLEVVRGRFRVHELDGGWSAAGAEKALAAWFRLGAERDRLPELVVCQNDAMAEGVRAAFRRQAIALGTHDLERVPLTGCDGLAEEGQARVMRGELTATVVLPPTTPTALDLLRRYWDTRTRTGTVYLEAAPFPVLDSLRAA
jgi:ABC-type sugar transport system substrate-binding protein